MTRATLILVALLAGCSPDVRHIALADVDLTDMQTVGEIRAQLMPKEQRAFANYVVRHHSASAKFCGVPLVASTGREPLTIGEAVDLSLLRDAAEQQALVEANKPKHPKQLAKEGWDKLIMTRDTLIDAQARLRMEFGDTATQRAEWKLLEGKLAKIDKELVTLKPTVFDAPTI